MIKIRNSCKNDCKINLRPLTLTIAVFLVTATVVVGPTTVNQQHQQQVLAQQQSEPDP